MPSRTRSPAGSFESNASGSPGPSLEEALKGRPEPAEGCSSQSPQPQAESEVYEGVSSAKKSRKKSNLITTRDWNNFDWDCRPAWISLSHVSNGAYYG